MYTALILIPETTTKKNCVDFCNVLDKTYKCTMWFIYLVFWDRVSLCNSSDCPGTIFVDQVCLCLPSAGKRPEPLLSNDPTFIFKHIMLFKKYFIIYFMFTFVCVRVSDPLELELQML